MTTSTPTKEMETADNLTLKQLFAQDAVKKRFNEILGPRRGAQFISSVITVWTGSKTLQESDPQSILGAAAQAAALDLSIVPTIGHAAIVPYKTKGKYVAQFQIMTRGIVQLAHRTSKYKKVHLAEIYEGQLVEYDEFKNDIVLDAKRKKSDKIEGFYFRFELTNGFIHEAYWSVNRCLAHGLKFSKSLQYGNGLWTEDPLFPTKKGEYGQELDLKAFKEGVATEKMFVTYGSGAFSMCAKTVVKNTITKWGPMTSDMQDAFTADQAMIKPDGTKAYIDAESFEGAVPTNAPMPHAVGEAPEGGAQLPAPAAAAPAFKEFTGTVGRIAGTQIKNKDVDVIAGVDKAGKETKFYTDVPEITAQARKYDAKTSVIFLYEEEGARYWLMGFKPIA